LVGHMSHIAHCNDASGDVAERLKAAVC
jgi:hypothetical protein